MFPAVDLINLIMFGSKMFFMDVLLARLAVEYVNVSTD